MSNHIQLIEIPKWGLSMEEGTVNQWLISEGDSFQVGDELVEIESSKIINVVEAHFAGTLRRIVANSGDTLPVAAPIGIAADVTVSDNEINAFIASLPSSQDHNKAITSCTSTTAPAKSELDTTATPNTGSHNTSVPSSLQEGEDDKHLHATLHARRLATELGVNLHNVPTQRRNSRIARQDVKDAITAAGGSAPSLSKSRLKKPSASTKDDSQVAATPVARRLAKQLGVNLHDCRTSGSRGRVSKADVEAAHSLTGTTTIGKADALTQAISSSGNEATKFPMDGMRRTIAARLQKSKQTAPHFRLTVDATIDCLLAIRKKLNDANPAAKVSINDFLIKASAAALVQVPACNIQFDGNTIIRFKDADISVAVALESGLITPIVKSANSKGLVEISNEVRALVTKAKAGTLAMDEFQGGTFSISNLGMFGVKQFDAIINPPQGAILAVGGTEQRMIVKDGEPTIATIITLTLSCDHRAIDGALGAQFLQKLKWLVEDPAMMMA